MSEIIIAVLASGILVYHAWYVRERNRELGKLINALISRTPEQYRDLELTEKVKPIEPPVKVEPEMLHESELTDEKFAELIGEQLR